MITTFLPTGSLQFSNSYNSFNPASVTTPMGQFELRSVSNEAATAASQGFHENPFDPESVTTPMGQFELRSVSNEAAASQDFPEHTSYPQLEMIQCLIECGTDIKKPTEDGHTYLYIAVRIAGLEVMKCLVDAGADVNAATGTGKTPLHVAVSVGDMAKMRYLVSKGADVNATTEGKTPLNIALESFDEDNTSYSLLEMVQSLIEYGTDIKKPKENGHTYLHTAVFKAGLEVVKYLVDAGADVNAATKTGRTPLHVAAYVGDMAKVRYLVSKGADINAKTNGKTPLKIASERKHAEVKEYFESKCKSPAAKDS